MNNFICQFCAKSTSNSGANKRHEKHCKSNPNSIKGKRSPLAGQKKGSIPWNKGKKVGRSPKWDDNYSLDKVLVQNSTYPRHALKKRILENELIAYVCNCCKIGPEWNGKPMPLILDHINGINNDNRLENLRFVCSNCDSQLETYKAKNIRIGGRAVEGEGLENL